MREQLDFIKTIQPYFVMETSRFTQFVLGQYGISHFYEYAADRNGLDRVVVPDGCIDIIFSYGRNVLDSDVCGTVLEYRRMTRKASQVYFGVRFFSGFCPPLIDGRFKEFVGREVSLQEVIKEPALLVNMVTARNFSSRIQTFMKVYQNFAVKPTDSSMERLLQAATAMIYKSHGEIRIKELEERTGYTARYINKLFDEEIGINPKKLCLIIKFQRLLTALHSPKVGTIAKLAAEHGYFDQAYLIKEFSRYTNMTPKQYFRMIHDSGYNERVITIGGVAG
ncbi:AraC-like DNA-binding protein [Sporomusaceae bacterium BoRhaA]|uniref:helix-turn-helix domain-containing protein n=1 Tax=Pelorhabdus rhamnosifermentans TaxID=2772457 RepID=UPI001C06479A|nr:AraC family transcriptional regulator [Pelorhabdus rhamnosifermentans]MBU2700756.1 AraC-like DNA-binding protein [Pelorhabdus rhamnosifermentans]